MLPKLLAQAVVAFAVKAQAEARAFALQLRARPLLYGARLLHLTKLALLGDLLRPHQAAKVWSSGHVTSGTRQ